MAKTGRHHRTPIAVRHRRDWLQLWRRCRCGLRWPACPDRGRTTLTHRALPRPDTPPRAATIGNPHPLPRPRNRDHNRDRNRGTVHYGWNAPTLITAEAAYTLGQQHRGRRAETTRR